MSIKKSSLSFVVQNIFNPRLWRGDVPVAILLDEYFVFKLIIHSDYKLCVNFTHIQIEKITEFLIMFTCFV